MNTSGPKFVFNPQSQQYEDNREDNYSQNSGIDNSNK